MRTLLNAVAQFVLQLVIVLAIAAALSALWALLRGGDFVYTFGTACFVLGSVALLFGAFGVGGMSPSLGLVETARLGRLPGMPAYIQTSPGTTVVNATAIFFLTGIVLFVIGFVIRG